MQLDVLINSFGPHERVRVQDPFLTLLSWGVEVRLHRAPFHLPTITTPHSIVIWQRPLAESWRQQLDILRWFRDRGCLLLTEWDDHPDLLPDGPRLHLHATNMAALAGCHLIHTSSIQLAKELQIHNPKHIVLENASRLIPPLDLEKHNDLSRPRVFIGNQNRKNDHQELLQGLKNWCRRDPELRLIIIQDIRLARQLPKHQVEFHRTCKYERYRELLHSCHLALMPLKRSTANACKTPIKWIESASESVACIGGPELYGSCIGFNERGVLVNDIRSLAEQAENLWHCSEHRRELVTKAHDWARNNFSIDLACQYRLWMYQHLWERRKQIDQHLLTRLPEARTSRSFPL